MTTGIELAVLHETAYTYAAPVSVAQHLAHLRPLGDTHQRVLQFDLAVDPPPPRLQERRDTFGNTCQYFTRRHRHARAPWRHAAGATLSAGDGAEAQREVQQGMADPWIRGIEAAEAHVALGDAQAAGRFYTSCVAMPFGIEWLTNACLDAIVRLGPARAFVLLKWMVEHPEQGIPGAGMAGLTGKAEGAGMHETAVAQVRNAGLDGLGRLAGGGALGAAQREQALQTLLAYATGKQNELYYRGAAAGLGASKDPRAMDPLRDLARRRGNDAAVREAAARGNHWVQSGKDR